MNDYADLTPREIKWGRYVEHAKIPTMRRCECGATLYRFTHTNMLTCEKCGENRWLTRPTST